MGCGGSVYAEDGSVAPGKGEVQVKWNAEKPVKVVYYYYGDGDAQLNVKDFPMDKTVAEKVFSAKGTENLGGGYFSLDAIPGERYATRWLANGYSIAFPGARPLEVPKLAYEKASADWAKTLKSLKDETQKIEGHPYHKDGGDDVAKADFEATKDAKCAAQFSDNLFAYKKAVAAVEDLQPYNSLQGTIGQKDEAGYLDEKDGKVSRQLGLADKAKAKAAFEGLKGGMWAKGQAKARSTKAKAFKAVLDGAIQGACKKLDIDVAAAAPNLEAKLESMDGVSLPGVALLDAPTKFQPDEALLPAESVEDDAFEAECKKQWEADKGQQDALRSADGNLIGEIKTLLKAAYDGSDELDAQGAINSGKPVNVDKGGVITAPAIVKSTTGDDANVDFLASIGQGEASATVPQKIDYYDGLTATKVSNFWTLPPPSTTLLTVGRWVHVLDGKETYEGYITKVEGDDVFINDQLDVPRKTSKANVRIIHTGENVARRGVPALGNFASLDFWWVAAEDPNVTVRKLRIWRHGARDETLQEFDLHPRKGPKKVKDGEPAGEVHIGYSAAVEVQVGRVYAYNFLIGADTYVSFDTKGTTDKAAKLASWIPRFEY